MRERPICSILTVLFLFGVNGFGWVGAQAPSTPGAGLVFEPTPQAGQFFAFSNGIQWAFRGAEMVARCGGEDARLSLVGARPDVVLEPQARAPGVSHYFVGRDPALWRRRVPHFRELRAHSALPGVHLVHRAADRDLEFDIVVEPGATRPGDLTLHIDASALPRLLDDGSIAVHMGPGELRLRVPVVYQEMDGLRLDVGCRYVLEGLDIRFLLGEHDPERPLTIDPVVTFATMLGGAAGAETARGVHIDALGNLLVTGTTQASDFPLLNNLPYNYRFDIGFITKFDPSGALVFSTFFGGTSGLVAPVDIGTDPNGQIVVGGNTTSPDLPTTGGVLQPALVGGGDWFFVNLDPTGGINWCTYYGGPGVQNGMRALKVLDIPLGAVLAVGNEGSFPYLSNAYSQTGGLVCGGIYAGNLLWASTACGFSGTPTAVDVSSQGHICITGFISGTGSGLPTTGASFQPAPASPGGVDGFVFVFTGQANSLVFATYFGGTGSDVPRSIQARPGPGTLAITIAGDTSSADLPVFQALQPVKGAIQDGFVAQIDSLTQSLVFSTYLGGSDPGESIRRVGGVTLTNAVELVIH